MGERGENRTAALRSLTRRAFCTHLVDGARRPQPIHGDGTATSTANARSARPSHHVQPKSTRSTAPTDWLEALRVLLQHARFYGHRMSPSPRMEPPPPLRAITIFQSFLCLRDQLAWRYILHLWYHGGYRYPALTCARPPHRWDAYAKVTAMVVQGLTAVRKYALGARVLLDALELSSARNPVVLTNQPPSLREQMHMDTEIWRMAIVTGSRGGDGAAVDTPLADWGFHSVQRAPGPIPRVVALLHEASWSMSLRVYLEGVQREWWGRDAAQHLTATLMSLTRHRRWSEGLTLYVQFVSSRIRTHPAPVLGFDDHHQQHQHHRVVRFFLWAHHMNGEKSFVAPLPLLLLQLFSAHPTGALWMSAVAYFLRVLTPSRARVSHWSALLDGILPKSITLSLWAGVPVPMKCKGRLLLPHFLQRMLDHGAWQEALAAWSAAPDEMIHSMEVLRRLSCVLTHTPWQIALRFSEWSTRRYPFSTWCTLEVSLLADLAAGTRTQRFFTHRASSVVPLEMEAQGGTDLVSVRLQHVRHLLCMRLRVRGTLADTSVIPSRFIRSFHQWEHACLALRILLLQVTNSDDVDEEEEVVCRDSNRLSREEIERRNKISITIRQVLCEDKEALVAMDHVMSVCLVSDRFHEALCIFRCLKRYAIAHRSTMVGTMSMLEETTRGGDEVRTRRANQNQTTIKEEKT